MAKTTMTNEELTAFAYKIVPDGALTQEDAEEWAAFLNTATGTLGYTAKLIPEPEEWASGMYYVMVA